MVAPAALMAAKAIADLIGPYVPKLIGKLTGSEKAKETAERVVAIAQRVTGKDEPETALEALKGNPALQLELAKHLATVDAQIEAEYLHDRQDARTRDVALQQGGQRNVRADWLALLSVITLWLLGWALFDSTVEGTQRELLIYLLGAVTQMVASVYQFEFGSSRGSELKTHAMIGKQ